MKQINKFFHFKVFSETSIKPYLSKKLKTWFGQIKAIVGQWKRFWDLTLLRLLWLYREKNQQNLMNKFLENANFGQSWAIFHSFLTLSPFFFSISISSLTLNKKIRNNLAFVKFLACKVFEEPGWWSPNS